MMPRALVMAAIIAFASSPVRADITDAITNEVHRCEPTGFGVTCSDDNSQIHCQVLVAKIYHCRVVLAGEPATFDGIDPDDLDLDGFLLESLLRAEQTVAALQGAGDEILEWANAEAAGYRDFLLMRVDAFCDALAEEWTSCGDGIGRVTGRWVPFLLDTPWRVLQMASDIIDAFDHYMVDLEDDVLLDVDLDSYGLPGSYHFDDGYSCSGALVSLLDQFEETPDCATRVEASAAVDVHCSAVNELASGRPHCPGEWSRDWQETYGALGVRQPTPDGSAIGSDTLDTDDEDPDEDDWEEPWIGDSSAVGNVDEFRAHMALRDGRWLIESQSGVFACDAGEGLYYARPVVVEPQTGFHALINWIHENNFDGQLDEEFAHYAGMADAVGVCNVTTQPGLYEVRLSDLRSTALGVASAWSISATGRFPCHVADEGTSLGARLAWSRGQPSPAVDASAAEHLHHSAVTITERDECGPGDAR